MVRADVRSLEFDIDGAAHCADVHEVGYNFVNREQDHACNVGGVCKKRVSVCCELHEYSSAFFDGC